MGPMERNVSAGLKSEVSDLSNRDNRDLLNRNVSVAWLDLEACSELRKRRRISSLNGCIYFNREHAHLDFNAELLRI